MLAAFLPWHGWAWEGWSALVAIGTLLLAISTGALAWFTYRVTKDSQRELELERGRLEASQRPIVLPAQLRYAHLPDAAVGEVHYALVLMNAGPGVAINIVCTLRWGPPSGLIATLPQFHMRPGGSDDPLVPIGQAVAWENVHGTITCVDLAGDTWTTEFTIRTEHDEFVIDVQAPTITKRAALQRGR